ncbi:glycogen/starch/alpha-glucan family phosphorylase [Petralouisia muris]|uniref:Glycogen/starch/alpha-glucan family phosphorylase n=1 Tax=Petralouisia muris TaxID=3032872 RepID=A0AC61S0P2_9FIRM|nr:glycogen/starch/alpha-glucan phosphorylase [Petralouisia muris]TGY98022.1 glycogen/starch/alpha-glucan family phosphorylase [Petralouisia muris]
MSINVRELLEQKCCNNIAACTNEQIYYGLLGIVKDLAKEKESNEGKKKIYYISAEFLIGKLLSNNLINLGIYDEVAKMLEQYGKDINLIEQVEPEPSLGNGGLGRLAACFLDSMATLGMNGDGIGLNYHFGLFLQTFENRLQKENKNPWLQAESWLTRTDVVYPIQFGGFTVWSRMYDLDVTGFENRTNKLHLFDIETVDEGLVGDGINFNKGDIMKNLTLFLYPDDSDDAGRLLRVYQQYFMVSNAARLILSECEAKGCKLYDLPDYAAIQINDTHPSMVIPELIRLLMERGIRMSDAIDIVSKTCAYTNHTILAEALEKWPMDYLNQVVPQLMPIIRELDTIVKEKYEDKSVAIIDDANRVHMAHMDIHYGYSVNGVAYLHTEILKKNELNNFYKIYPEKFNNKTNGITFRRWLMHCNKGLSHYLDEIIGTGWHKNADELEKLLAFADDRAVLDKLLEIKHENKKNLAAYLKEYQGLEIDENSIFDIQIKRLHEYKRQQMNALYVIHKYLEIKKGKKPATPITVIFGAKAAPAYVIAKDIIHLILCLQELVNNDPEVSPYLKVVMVENYNVTNAEKLIPACDISEQISLASKEASGTGNMKFMLNGAVTLGTMDGANVEIADLVGKDNIYIFGESSDTVIEHYEKADYVSRKYYEENEDIKEAVDFIVSEELMKVGHREHLERLYHELLNKDWFMTLLDYEDYAAKKEEMYKDYEDRTAWAKKMLVNTAKAGFFSSDRTIAEYDKDIWKLS